MDCAEKIYVNTDVDIILNPKSGFVAGDVSDLVITLTDKATGTLSVTYSFLGGGVSIDNGIITLLILKGDITVPGWYSITARLFDQTQPTAKERGLTPCVLPDEVECLEFKA